MLYEVITPTAVNLAWAVDRMLAVVPMQASREERLSAIRNEASKIAEEEVGRCRRIGEHGAQLVAALSKERKGATVNILTHCNAGWLACVEWGTATAPIYRITSYNVCYTKLLRMIVVLALGAVGHGGQPDSRVGHGADVFV